VRRPVAAAVLAAALASPADGMAGRVYGGQPTPAGHPSRMLVSMRLDGEGTRVERLVYRADLDCNPRLGVDGYMAHGTVTPVAAFPPPKRDGRNLLLDGVVDDGRIAWNLRRIEDAGGGVTATIRATIEGQVTDTLASGSATFLVHLRRGREETDACAAVVRWRADRRPGSIFAGSTAQHEPIVLERSPDGTRVRHAHVAWHAACPSGGGFGAPHDELGWLSPPLRRDGSFAFTHAAPALGAVVRTRLAGRFGAARAAGTFRAGATFGAPGAERCQTGPLRWTALTG
jgi:hypothetical protein